MDSRNRREGLVYGEENVRWFTGVNSWEAFGKAREAARIFAGMTGPTILFVQELGPWAGHITGSQSVDHLHGWRLDLSRDARQLHLNWWDNSLSPDRSDKGKCLFGANYVTGGGADLYWQIIAHYPPR